MHEEAGQRGGEHAQQHRETVHHLGRGTGGHPEGGDDPDGPGHPVGVVERPEGEGDAGDPADGGDTGEHTGVAVRDDEGRRHGRTDEEEPGLQPPGVGDQAEGGDAGAGGEQCAHPLAQRREAGPVAGDDHEAGGEDDGGSPGQRHAALPLPPVEESEAQGGGAQQRGENGGEEQGGGGGDDPVEHGYKLVINVSIWYE